MAGVVSGTGGGRSLTKTGTGTLALLAHNTYAGGTSIDGGAVSFASAGIPIPGGGLTIDGGTLQWGSSNNDDVSPLAIGSGGATLDTNGRDVTLGSVVSDRPGPPGALTKVGDGTLRLDANNTYSGGTTVTRGLISFSSPGDLGSGNITLNRGGLQWASGNVDVSPRLNPIGSGGATFDTVNSDVAFAKPLTGSGSVTKQGTGTLALGGANTYSGMTEIANGAIDVPRGSSVAGPVLVGSGSALSVEGTISGRVTLASGGNVGCNNGTLGGGLTNNGGTALGAPNAPSGASATPGNGHATVSFTPGDAHCFPVGYTATSSPGGVHGTGFGSPVTVTPLTDGTTYTFTVTATNPIGTSASGSSNAVKPLGPAPIAHIAFPANGQKFKFGQFVATEFSCLDGGGGPGISACTDSTHGNLVLDTSHPGTFKYTVIAVSKDGQATIAQILYVVMPPSNNFKPLRVHPNRDGSVSFSLKLPWPGTVDVLETAAKSNRATAASLKPGKGQFAFASVHGQIKKAGTARFRIKPNAAGRALMKHHRHPVVIRLSITYTPAQGEPRTDTIKALRLTR